MLEVHIDLVHEGLGDEVVSALNNLVGALDEDGEILGHEALLNSVDDGLLKRLREQSQLLVAIKLGTMAETTGPGEDGGNGVGGG